jgi:hypothetical protein
MEAVGQRDRVDRRIGGQRPAVVTVVSVIEQDGLLTGTRRLIAPMLRDEPGIGVIR